jgi:ABC-type multidrug transport system permease subunit
MLNAARAVMLDGARLPEVWPQVGVLLAMAVVFLAIAAAGFRWRAD